MKFSKLTLAVLIGISTTSFAQKILINDSINAIKQNNNRSKDLIIQNKDGRNMFTLSGNNIGINEGNPKHTLDVAGSVGLDGHLYVYGTDIHLGGKGRDIGTKTAQRALVHGSSDRLMINYSGDFEGGINVGGTNTYFENKVGIGIHPMDGYMLAVEGSIRSREVKVDLDDWPDYVFLANYRIPSLTEIENFIKQHGHLKNVPSKADVLSDGVNLGEMNRLLLEKIEELTLYTIEQDKQLKKQNEQLKYQGLREKELQKQLVEQQELLRSLLKRIEILEHE